MKTYLPLFLGILLGICTPCFAPWAKHEVVHAEEADASGMSITREVVGATEFLHITMPVKERPESHKGYFLVTTREPLPEDSMELRLAMNFWMNSMKGANLQSKDMPALKENKSVLLIQRVELLELKKRGDHFMVDVLIPSELGSRSYLVFDFKPHGGARVMDGGLWLTYDLPSIIRAQLDSK